jgi:hypothetical protein
MSSVEEDVLIRTTATVPNTRPHRLRVISVVLTSQYLIVAAVVSLAVAGILRYLVTPQIVEKFEMIAAALKR